MIKFIIYFYFSFLLFSNLSANQLILKTSSAINQNGWGSIADWYATTNYQAAKVGKANVDFGSNSHIAIFDGGVLLSHDAFNLLTDVNSVLKVGTNYSKGSGNSNHGTHVAGLMAGIGMGLSYKSELTTFLIFPDRGDDPSDAQIKAWITSTKERGIDVANHSWGFTCAWKRQCKDTYHYQGYFNAFRLSKSSTLHVLAAGNHNADMKTVRVNFMDSDLLKRGIKNLIFVGALNKTETRIAGFSVTPGNGCFKGRTERRCTTRNKYKYYFVVAPGYTISAGSSDNGDRTVMAGTSMAAPIVSGQAALIKSKWGHLKPVQIREIIMKTATDMGKRGVDDVYGWGKINIAKSLTPIRGKVGGVDIRSRNRVFSTASSMNLLDNAPTIMDEYDRDFSLAAMDSVDPTQTFYFIPLTDSLEKDSSIGLFIDDAENIIGASLGGISFATQIIDNHNLDNASIEEPDLVLIPAFLAKTNPDANNFSYQWNEDTVFYVTQSNSSDGSATQPSIMGMNYQLFDHNQTRLTFKLANVEETGFYGISSQTGFGFTQRSDSTYYGATLNHDLNDQLQLSVGFNSLQSTAQEEGKYVSRNNLGVANYEIGLTNHIDEENTLSLRFDSGNFARGTMETQIDSLADPATFYTPTPSMTLQHVYENQAEDYAITFFGQASATTQGNVGISLNYSF